MSSPLPEATLPVGGVFGLATLSNIEPFHVPAAVGRRSIWFSNPLKHWGDSYSVNGGASTHIDGMKEFTIVADADISFVIGSYSDE